MSAIFVLNIFILSGFFLGFFLFMGGELSSIIFWSLFFCLIEAMICVLIAVNFSLVTNKTLSIIYAFSLYIAGHSVNEALIKRFSENRFFSDILKNYHFIFPGFSKLNFKSFVTFGQQVSDEILLSSMAYGLFYLLAMLLLGSVIFSKRNID